MRRYQLYTAMICVAAGLAAGGCAANAQAENLETSAQETSAPETTVEDTVVETVTGAIESMEESQPQELGLIRIFGPVTKMEEGRLSMNRQDVAVEEGQEDEIPGFCSSCRVRSCVAGGSWVVLGRRRMVKRKISDRGSGDTPAGGK